MADWFNNHPTWSYRALQTWLILIGKAANRQTLTYGDLAGLLGFDGASVLAHPLDRILCYCEVHELPPLTCLVVNQSTGLPGDGLQIDNLHSDRERVYNYAWYGLIPPTPEELAQAHAQMRG